MLPAREVGEDLLAFIPGGAVVALAIDPAAQAACLRHNFATRLVRGRSDLVIVG